MFTWRKWWLLFAVLWGVVAALQVITILAFSPDEQAKALQPALFGVGIPAAAYLLGWVWERVAISRERRPRAK
ncbi:MAG TPA: hypothetical protein VFU24_14170 [Burkholderiales bacterium]|nr:hypothetical protein [Burkholderiales bacterium]